jgi:hypothetical protein
MEMWGIKQLKRDELAVQKNSAPMKKPPGLALRRLLNEIRTD